MKTQVWKLTVRVMVLVLSLGAAVALTGCGNGSEDSVLSDNFSEVLGEVKAAEYDIDAGDGNLSVSALGHTVTALVSGQLQYVKGQAEPARTLVSSGGQATLTLKGSAATRSWLRLPWAACNGATEWRIQLNPAVAADITAHSNGGNVNLDLLGMIITRVAADTGGGNMNVVLPEDATDLSVTAKTGAGNATVELGNRARGNCTLVVESGAGEVTVRIPNGAAARIRATTGLGKVTVDPTFAQTGDSTYQSPDYDRAADRIDLTLSSGAGNVNVNTK